MLKKYVEDLCDRFAHFGEFLQSELKDAGATRYGLRYYDNISTSQLSQVYNGKAGIGPAASKAFGEVLGYPPDHFMNLYKLFKAEKKRRAEEKIQL